METTALALTRPQIAIQSVQELMTIVRELREHLFQPDVDFGVIPGTNNKPTLLLPGMEKLMRALRLVPKYVELSKIEDFDKSLIFYRYECQLIEADTGTIIATAIGSANSHESKWRWREQNRKCPKCGVEAIKRSKFPPRNNPSAEPGWYCFDKLGGCGANFDANDTSITEQITGRVENPDIFDQMNTIDKIAQKRSLSSAIKGAANVSEFFTVDLEDLPPSDYVTITPAQNEPQPPPPAPENANSAPQPPSMPDDKQTTPETPQNAQEGAKTGNPDDNSLFDAIPPVIVTPLPDESILNAALAKVKPVRQWAGIKHKLTGSVLESLWALVYNLPIYDNHAHAKNSINKMIDVTGEIVPGEQTLEQSMIAVYNHKEANTPGGKAPIDMTKDKVATDELPSREKLGLTG